MGNPDPKVFLVHLGTKDNEALLEKQARKEREGLQVPEGSPAFLDPKEIRACPVWTGVTGSQGCLGQRVSRGNRGLLVTPGCRDYLGSLEFRVQRVLLVKRVTQALLANLGSWGIQASRASRGLQERWALEDPGVCPVTEERWDQWDPPACQANWALWGVLASPACLVHQDFQE